MRGRATIEWYAVSCRGPSSVPTSVASAARRTALDSATEMAVVASAGSLMRACPQCAKRRATRCTSSARRAAFRSARSPPTRTTRSSGARSPAGYVILELVGIGGMGRVYRAEQTNLGRTVAVKIIHPHLVGEENAAARFITEARAASRLNHPNSVAVIDFGKTPDGQLYLVMEFLRGRDLARVAYEEGPLPVPADRRRPPADARGARRSAPPRHHPPRPEAREHHPRADADRRRLREGRRLRAREDARDRGRSRRSRAPGSSAARPST